MNMAIKKSRSKGKEIKDEFSVDENESMDICTFSDGEIKLEGNLLKSFSFDSEEELVEDSLISSTKSSSPSNVTSFNNAVISGDNNDILDHRTLKANPNGRTPAIDGEAFDMVRSYTLRRSTIRILSKIKVIHSDDNVYLNTIVDEAIRYYYEYLKAQSIK